jgi:hypothetical protein
MKEAAEPITQKVKKEETHFQNRKESLSQYRVTRFDNTLNMQRSLGNMTIQRMVESKVIQAKLKIGQPGDKYEQEADHIADQVMRMPEETTVQRKSQCTECKEEEEENIQAKSLTDYAGAAEGFNPGLQSRLNSLKGGGQPLPESTRSFFEPRFGRELDRVRVHDNSQAAKITTEINAKAFTTGKDVIFGAGYYSPGTREGKWLLAHELTHVIQQNGSNPPDIQKVSLHDYNDADPLHDPSRLTDADIEATDEFIDLDILFSPPSADVFSREEKMLACRLVLRALREGRIFVFLPMFDGLSYLLQARAQLGSMQGVESFENQLNWVPFSSPTAVADPTLLLSEFGRWILAGEAQPSFITGSINCWEAILFGAFQQGYITEARIRAIYTLAVNNVAAGTYSSVGDTVERELREGNIYIFDPTNPDSPSPLVGDMVVFDRAAVHAAISTGVVPTPPHIYTGEHEILSLWTGNSGHVERTTIEELVRRGASTPVRFWSVRW